MSEAQARPAVASEGLRAAVQQVAKRQCQNSPLNCDPLTVSSYPLCDTCAARAALASDAGSVGALPTLIVNFGPDATPEQVEVAMEQIRALPLDVERLARAIHEVNAGDEDCYDGGQATDTPWHSCDENARRFAAAYDAERPGDAPAGEGAEHDSRADENSD